MDYGFVEVIEKAKKILDHYGRREYFCTGVECCDCPFNHPLCDNGLTIMFSDHSAEFAEFVMNYELEDEV